MRLKASMIFIIVFLLLVALPSQVSAQTPGVIDESLIEVSTTTSIDTTPQENAPHGVFTIETTFENGSADSFANLFFAITTLHNGNLVLNADGGPAGEGGVVSVEGSQLGTDGVLNPGETFTQTFEIGLNQAGSFDFLVSANGNGLTESALVDADLTMNNLVTNYDPSPQTDAPAGVFTITATFTNTSTEAMAALFSEIAILTNGNVVLNTDGGPAGEGGTVSIGSDQLGEDGVLSPGESFVQVFEIGLQAPQQFNFFIHQFGSDLITPVTTPGPGPVPPGPIG